jgi:hypothetical protein
MNSFPYVYQQSDGTVSVGAFSWDRVLDVKFHLDKHDNQKVIAAIVYLNYEVEQVAKSEDGTEAIKKAPYSLYLVHPGDIDKIVAKVFPSRKTVHRDVLAQWINQPEPSSEAEVSPPSEVVEAES